jgi:hypothetical protein
LEPTRSVPVIVGASETSGRGEAADADAGAAPVTSAAIPNVMNVVRPDKSPPPCGASVSDQW